MHNIQRHIIEQLSFSKTLRYSQLKPERVESNLFAYHLKQLQHDKLVEKYKGQYRLAPSGLHMASCMSFKTHTIREQPLIVTLVNLENKHGQTMLYRRQKQPFIDMLGFPSGKLHLDEPILAAANREVAEKLCLKPVLLQHSGTVYITIKQSGVLISQTLSHVFCGVTDQILPKNDNLAEQRFWATPTPCNSSEYVPGFYEIKKLLREKTFFFEELVFSVD